MISRKVDSLASAGGCPAIPFRKRGVAVTHRAIQVPLSACLMIVALLFASGVTADPLQEPPDPKKDKAEKAADPEADEQHRREAEALVNGIALEMLVVGKWSKVKR